MTAAHPVTPKTLNRWQYSLLKLPLSVVQRAHLPSLQPTGDTVEMERMLQQKLKRKGWDTLISIHLKKETSLIPSPCNYSTSTKPFFLQWNYSKYELACVSYDRVHYLRCVAYNKLQLQIGLSIGNNWRIPLENVLLTLQTPQATVHSSDVAEAWLAWHSIPLWNQNSRGHVSLSILKGSVMGLTTKTYFPASFYPHLLPSV